MFLSHWEARGTLWRTGQGLCPWPPALQVYLAALLLIASFLLDLRVSIRFWLCLLPLLLPQYLVLHCLPVLLISLPGECLLLHPQTERTTDGKKKKRKEGKKRLEKIGESCSFMLLYLKPSTLFTALMCLTYLEIQ